jgi:TonB family protein
VSLTACPECSRQISTAAFACPGCGHPAQAAAAVPIPRRRIDWLVPAIAAGGLLTSLVGGHVMWNAFQAQHAYSRGPRVEVVRAIEVHQMRHPLPPPPIVDFAVERSVVEAFEMHEMGELPRIRNAREVSRMISRVYPPALREAGVPGHVVARFQVTEEGLVDPATIGIEAATHSAFGDPAMRVIQRMRFEPALVDGHPVSTWMTVPITFAPPR